MSEDRKLYLVKWIDSRGCQDRWTDLDDIESSVCELSSVGWAIKETDEFIHLMPHIGNDPAQGCGDMTIPKTCITEITRMHEFGKDRLDCMKADLNLLNTAISEGDDTDQILLRVKDILAAVEAELNHIPNPPHTGE